MARGDAGRCSDDDRPGNINPAPVETPIGFRDTCGKCGAKRIDSQLGLEPTPEQYVESLVAVFREVRRVLRDDGTVWLNLGSSFFSGESYPLREVDAAWLAAVIDGEGCIQIHRQKKPPQTNSVDSFQLDLSVGMMTPEVVQRAHELTGLGSCHQQNRGVWDWSVRGQQTGRLLRAVYPHLLIKKKQAALAIMLCDDLAEKRFGRGNPATPEAMEWRQQIKQAVSDLNQRRDIDFLIREPKPLALGLKPKDDVGIPHRVAFALRDDGWFLRSDVVWSKPNPMPESVTDRPTRAHEFIFLLTKSARYFYDADAIREANPRADEVWASGGAIKSQGANGADRNDWGRGIAQNPLGANKRSVWNVTTQPYPEAHFATFPPKLVEPCILAGSPPKCCGECGAPWERDVRTTVDGKGITCPKDEEGWNARKATMDGGPLSASRLHGQYHNVQRETVGWQPTCDHGLSGGGVGSSSCRSNQGSPSAEPDGLSEGNSPGRHGTLPRSLGMRADVGQLKDAGSADPLTEPEGRDLHPTCSHGYSSITDVSDDGTGSAVVLDPFCGSGTTGLVALRHNRSFIGIELNPDYCELARNRIRDDAPLMNAPSEVVHAI